MRSIKEVAFSLGPEITIHENPVSFPLLIAKDGYDFEGGLVDTQNNTLITEAILLRHNNQAQVTPDKKLYKSYEIKISKEKVLLFGGVLFNNFGHFLLESLGRLWAYDTFREFDPSIMFYAPWGIPEFKKKNHYIRQTLDALSIPFNRLIFFSEPTQLKTVIVPAQKYGFGICRNPDHHFKYFIESFRLPKKFLTKGPKIKDIYVSRSKLPINQGRPLGEIFFEKYLRSNGYYILHPENHSVYEQLAIYKQAERIIFCDGGATYATILLPEIKADIAIVARRRDHRWNYLDVTEHFVGSNKKIFWVDEVIAQYQFGLETWDAVGEIEWNNVSQLLKNERFVTTEFTELNAPEYLELKRSELKMFIKSIQANPLFFNYMENLKEQYPIFPSTL